MALNPVFTARSGRNAAFAKGLHELEAISNNLDLHFYHCQKSEKSLASRLPSRTNPIEQRRDSDENLDHQVAAYWFDGSRTEVLRAPESGGA